MSEDPPAVGRLREAAAPFESPALADWPATVVAWQRRHGRHALPWQATRDPYRVWLSEVMLQQTQVKTVLTYYGRFLACFPNVQALAAAPLDEVLAAWAGLGYYRRARLLHAGAQAVVAEHGGCFPATAAGLQALPGIGRSTAAAIAAFCFGERAAILDGNVKRVLARAFGLGEPLQGAAAERRLWARAETLLPPAPEDMPAYTQGLMDLGATVCTPRSPACVICPLADRCVARAEGQPEAYPLRGPRLQRGRREHHWLWLVAPDGAVWMQQRPAEGVWAGLWTLPLIEGEAALQGLLDTLAAGLGQPLRAELQPTLHHALTHFEWVLHPRRLELPARPAALPEGLLPGRWLPPSAWAGLALPAPLKKLLAA